MSTYDSGNFSAPPVPVPARGLPPLLPPPLPEAPKTTGVRTRTVVIILACVAAVVLFLVAGLVVVVLAFRAHAHQSAPARTFAEPAPPNSPEVASPRSDPGVTHTNDRIPAGPWSIHIVKVDRSRKDLSFYAPIAKGTILGVSGISDQADAIPPAIGRALAGVNGDFYERDNPLYAGDPRGLQIIQGELVSATSTACVWFDAQGQPHVDDVKGDFKVTWPDRQQTLIGLNQQRLPKTAVLYTPIYGTSTRVTGGRELILVQDGNGPWLPLQAGQTYRAKVREVRSTANTPIPADALVLSLGPALAPAPPEVPTGAILEISTATNPDLKGVPTAIAGGPALIQAGKPFVATALPSGERRPYSEASKYERHPRSAIGWNATHVYLVTVDGRQPRLSVGMTLAELAQYLVKLGCTDGMNFDGGASASMWYAGRIINDPCQGERAVANSFFVIRKPDGP